MLQRESSNTPLRVVALMIGRGGSSLPDKNILPVHGIPLLLWAAAAAKRSRYINEFYISSDDEKILKTAISGGYTPIVRPAELSSATAQSCDAVRHALTIIEKKDKADLIVVQHANVGTITEHQIDACIDLLLRNDLATSVVPAHEKAEYHPMRAKRQAADGYLLPYVDGGSGASPNRQELPKCLFFDHSFWVLRGRSAIFDPEGQGPWPCMGSKILPYETHGCLDVHDLSDLKKTEEWISAHNISSPSF